jgi:ABC-type sugar transport system substrate-binding protein
MLRIGAVAMLPIRMFLEAMKMDIQRAAVYSAALVWASISIQGCHGKNHHIVAVIPSISSDARWLSFHVGIMEAAQSAGLEPHWSGPSEDSNSFEQIELADQAIEQRAYGLILEPSSLIATNGVIIKAQSHRIPVVVITESSEVPDGEHLYRVKNDADATGALIAMRVKQLIQEDGSVAIFGLRSETPGNIERADAVTEALKRDRPSLQIIKRSMDSSSISYEQHLAREFIRAHPDIKVIIALSSQESYASAAAVRAENAMARIKVIGCDQTLALFLMLRAGAIDSLVVQDMRTMGKLAISLVVNDRQGKHPPAISVVRPILITAANIDDERVQQVILMHKESDR